MSTHVLCDITPKRGRLNQSDIWDLTWLDLEERTLRQMVVDSSYRNYARWKNIIDTNLLGEYAGIRRSARLNHRGQAVMSADSHPQLVTPLTPGEICQIIEAVKSADDPNDQA
jgi:hypothetical protein